MNKHIAETEYIQDAHIWYVLEELYKEPLSREREMHGCIQFPFCILHTTFPDRVYPDSLSSSDKNNDQTSVSIQDVHTQKIQLYTQFYFSQTELGRL